MPARARLERLIEWVLPVAEEIGARAVPRDPERERRRAADRAPRGGRDLEEIYAEQVGARSVSVAEDERTLTPEELQEQIGQLKVSDVLAPDA